MTSALEAPQALPVLYRDEALFVVNKPSGLAVHRGWARDEVTALSLARNQSGQRVFPAHRLDRGTSGALVFTSSGELAAAAQASLVSGTAKKLYVCIVRGVLPDDGFIEHAIAKSKQHEKRPARTAFRRLAQFERYSLALVRPFTGRLHQIRRHLKHISHPVIGDTRYGKGEHNRLFRERFGLWRSSLHALRLQFPHPESGAPIDVWAEPPRDLASVLDVLGFAPAIGALQSEPLWDPEPSGLRQFVDEPFATAD